MEEKKGPRRQPRNAGALRPASAEKDARTLRKLGASPPTPTIATVSEGTHAAVLVLLFSVSAYCGTSYFRVAGGDSSREFSDAAPRLEPFGSVWRGDRWAGSDLPRRKIRSVWDEIDRLLARAQLHARACA